MLRTDRLRRIRATLVGTAALALVAPLPALAQDAVSAGEAADAGASADTGGTIVVTGSRIQRRDFESDSPIITVGDDALKSSSSVSLDQSLAKLPQFVAG